MNVRYRVELNQAERSELTAMLSGGKRAARKLKRAQILLAADGRSTSRCWQKWSDQLLGRRSGCRQLSATPSGLARTRQKRKVHDGSGFIWRRRSAWGCRFPGGMKSSGPVS